MRNKNNDIRWTDDDDPYRYHRHREAARGCTPVAAGVILLLIAWALVGLFVLNAT